jgi:FkbM family methyltransferase
VSRVIRRVADNLWLLGICRDVATWRALKSRGARGADRGELGHLRLRGLRGDLLFRPDATDLAVVWELFQGQEYAFEYGWPFRSILDCGANIGVFLAWLLRASSGHPIRYVAVEADPDAFRVLTRQAESMRAGDSCTLLQAAVWDRDGEVSFDDSGPSWGHHVGEGGQRRVRAMTLPTILDQAGMQDCDLLKLDVEGGERSVLPSLVSCAERIGAVVAELHDGLDYAWFASVVERAGYRAFPPGRLFRSHPGALRIGSALEQQAASARA